MIPPPDYRKPAEAKLPPLNCTLQREILFPAVAKAMFTLGVGDHLGWFFLLSNWHGEPLRFPIFPDEARPKTYSAMLARYYSNRSFPFTTGLGSYIDKRDGTVLALFGQGVILIKIRPSKPRVGPLIMLGPLEMQVMNVVWEVGRCSVRDVVDKLPSSLAYTTVMTTLDRLFKKGLLDRVKEERAFLYSPALSSQEWERRRAGDLVAGFLSGPQPARDLLLSSLVDAVGQYDAQMLDELEAKIRNKRQELSRKLRP